MSIYDPTFTSAQVAESAGMSHVTFRARLSRKQWRIIGGEKSGTAADGNGKKHLFTIYDALGFALACELEAYGIEPEIAFKLAMFDYAMASSENGRNPGDVFDIDKHGRTLFVYSKGAERGQCIAATSIKSAADLFVVPMGSYAHSAILIDLNHLRGRVFNSLGLDARDYE
jgi:hypothetical protein